MVDIGITGFSSLLWILIGLQIFMGAFDTLFHHEVTERLAWRPSQRRELKLHAVRNGFYALVFLVLGFGRPTGLLATGLLVLLAAEVLITLWDFVEEDRSRKLPPSERVTHTLLALNYGAILILLAPVLLAWQAMPTGLAAAYHGAWSWMCLAAAMGVGIFGLRDFAASERLGRMKERPACQLSAHLPGRRTVLVTGGTGFVGARVVAALVSGGHDVIVLTRTASKAQTLGAPLRVITSLDQIGDFETIDAIINLAGEPVATGLWTQKKKSKIITSRLTMMRDLIGLTKRLVTKPGVMVSASAIGWYGMRGAEPLTEDDDARDCFSHQSCDQAEKAAQQMEIFGVRVVRLRIGLVLGTEGGLLARLLLPFEFGLGGPIGDGRQFMSWISRDDLVRLIIFAIANPRMQGAINAVAPGAVSNADFAKALGRALARPAVMPLPAFPLKLLAGQFAEELLLGGQHVVPEKALAAGFRFEDANVGATLARLVGAKPAAQNKPRIARTRLAAFHP
ncbi:MAG: TIGR01777 family oxidoreductase [Pseudomonadota bacterium]